MTRPRPISLKDSYRDFASRGDCTARTYAEQALAEAAFYSGAMAALQAIRRSNNPHDGPTDNLEALLSTMRSQETEIMAFLFDEANRTPLPKGEAIVSDQAKIEAALELAVRYGQIDGAHHKAWVIDQMVRALTGTDYARVVAEAKAGKDGPDTYGWDEGIAP